MLILFISILLFLSPLQAQVTDFPQRDIHISVGLEAQEYNLLIDDEDSGRSLVYAPSVNELIVPKITYKDLFSLSMAFNLPVSEDYRRAYGESEFTDLRFALDYMDFRWTLFYLQYKGFYLEKSQDVDPTLGNGNSEFILPDLYARSFGGEFAWIKNKDKFSLKALTNQTERVEGSGGSLLFGASFAHARFSSPTVIIPPLVQNEFSNDPQLTSATFMTLATKVGYGYILADKWFLGGAIQLGPGITQSELIAIDGAFTQAVQPSLRFELLASGGYNGDVFFTSLTTEVKQDYFYSPNSSTNIGTQLLSAGLNFGVHLESLGL